MNGLDLEGRNLLELLVETLKAVVPGDPSTYITYKRAHEKLGLENVSSTYGESLKQQGLNSLADWIKRENKPGITGLIVDRQTKMPGPGFFSLFGKTTEDFSWWAEQVRLSKEYDWTPYLTLQANPSEEHGQTYEALQSIPPPLHQMVFVDRIIRDSIIVRQVKEWHNYHCQICGLAIVLNDGTLYAEGHHIRPLGSPHNGPDVAENILCVCPNHHVELDYAVREISLNQLSLAPQHKPDPSFVDYHNQVRMKQKAN